MEAIFSIPYNGDPELVAEAVKSGKVGEVYFAMPGHDSAATRHFGIKASQDISGEARRLASMLRLCNRHKIKTNMLCNAPYLSDFQACGNQDSNSKSYNFPEKIVSCANIIKPDAITISDPLFISFFRKRLPGVSIHASVIMNIDSAEKARQAFMAGVKVITPAAEVNRNLNVLEAIAETRRSFEGTSVKLMSNYYCGYDCLYRASHYASRQNGCLPKGKDCFFIQKYSYEILKRPFIRPEDISFYAERGLADIFKIIARYQPSSQLKKIYAAYFSGEYNGNLYDLIGGGHGNYGHSSVFFLNNVVIPSEFVIKTSSCSKNCENCGWCGKIYKKAVSKSLA